MAKKRIGDFLLDKGLITEGQIEEILRHSQQSGLRFGDAAIDLRIVTREKMVEVFGPNHAVDFFTLDPEHFPEISRDLFSVDWMLKSGAIPLGFKTEYSFFRKRKMLNLGLLDPGRADLIQAAEREAKTRLGDSEVYGIKPFLILTEQFLQVMRINYGMTEASIRQKHPDELENTLVLFLENVV